MIPSLVNLLRNFIMFKNLCVFIGGATVGAVAYHLLTTAAVKVAEVAVEAVAS